MKKVAYRFFTGIIISFMIFGSPVPVLAQAFSQSLDVAKVDVKIAGNILPSATITKRMSESVKTIGEHMLLGQTVSEVSDHRETYERNLRDIFERVFIGYSIDTVRIIPGTDCIVQMSLIPWGDTIKEVNLNIDYSGLSIGAVNLLQRDLVRMEDQIKSGLLGLPIDAAEWATGAYRSLIREILKDRLPEFRFNVDVEPSQKTTVRLTIIPTGVLIREVRVSTISSTVPNVLMLTARLAVEAALEEIRGLPVAYIERHADYYKEKAQKAALQDSWIRRFQLRVTPTVKSGSVTEIVLDTETEKYRVAGEVYLDIGRSNNNFSALAHLGRKISPEDELFFEFKLIPGTVSTQSMPGWGHRFGGSTTAGIKYRFPDDQGILWLQQNLGGRWSFRAERIPGLNWNEIALRYRLQDLMSIEFIMNNESNWIRLVGHL